jgi:DNA-binding protein HU-beta/integration host factor subunit alpha
MTKQDLVLRISEKTGMPQSHVADVIEQAFDGIIDSLGRGEGIELRNFGVFEVRFRKPRIGRNPADPTKEYPIPARAVVKFKPGKLMKEVVVKLQTGKDSNSQNPAQ